MWWIRFEVQCPLGEWLKLGQVEAQFNLRAVDAREPGIEDTIPVTVQASPFAPDANDAGRVWVRQGNLDQEPEPPLLRCWFDRAHRRYSWEPSSTGARVVSTLERFLVPAAPALVPSLELAPAEPLDAAAAELVAAGIAGETRRGYAGDLARYAAWCAGRGLDPIPATAQRMAN